MDIDLYKILIIVAIERNNIMANNDFIIWAKNNNWDIILNSNKSDLPNSIKSRYNIPKQWYDFICGIQVCENDNATKWFLTPRDYLPNEEGFQWNEFELQSLEYGSNAANIASYWNKHLPVFMSVDGEYSYYAINTENGNVVYGCEPEYEDSAIAADDFETFINKIISGEIVL